MRILLFLVDIVFFILVGAALLRAWMNHLRVSMQAQPGRFVMAVTDWLVQPLRRLLPAPLSKGRVDGASLVAALLLSALHALVWLLLASGGDLPGLAWAVLTLKFLLRTLLQGFMFLLIVYAVLSWVNPRAPAMGLLDRLCAPVVAPVRRVVPLVGGVDLSVLIVIVLLQIGLMLLG
ncbi:YggT family protein [Hydrogenophaga sp. XSHU_21]|jgi:YggT family protein